ncbi:formate dehydrogenase FDH3 subunit beta [Vibrio algicola]|uniref:4Fe-4S dicluster domain-containing protein n=1 Tax=Vibrio algicola TaxID=2662262 RepID=A0A5Q0TE15_9VIBR|nr:formate dehydrogenase FDH3 subunit beta [Vibrio algicola]
MSSTDKKSKMKFLCDSKRCIECNGCVTACKNENDDALEWGIQRRRVVTINDGEVGEASISVACMHCDDAPCMAVCPADCFHRTEDNIVLHNKDLCIGCGYCLFACPFGAPQFIQHGAFAERGKMDKCTFCAGGPETEAGSEEERKKYGANRIAEGKLPMCASLCSTKALMAGPAEQIAGIMAKRAHDRGDVDDRSNVTGVTYDASLAHDATQSSNPSSNQ